MAKKLGKKRPAPPPPPPPPPAPPSSSSDEEGSSSDEEGSSSGSQEPITKSPNPKTPTNNQEADGESESGSSDEETVAKSPVPKTPPNIKGEGTDDGSESDSADDKEDDEEAEKPRPDTKKPESVCTAAAASSDLKPSDAGEKSNKKGKDSGKGKSLFQRIWSLDDEITILKGIIEFESKHGRHKRDGAGIRDFHHFVKDSLSLEVNDTQLYEKIRRLKRKYETAAARARKMGKAVMSGKPHDVKVYELSEEIWGAAGNENGARVNSKMAAKRRAAVAAAVASDGVWGSLKRKYLFFNDALVNAGQDVSAEVLAALDPEKAMLFENKFRKQRVEDLKCNIQELDLVKQALNSIVEEIESTVD